MNDVIESLFSCVYTVNRTNWRIPQGSIRGPLLLSFYFLAFSVILCLILALSGGLISTMEMWWGILKPEMQQKHLSMYSFAPGNTVLVGERQNKTWNSPLVFFSILECPLSVVRSVNTKLTAFGEMKLTRKSRNILFCTACKEVKVKVPGKTSALFKRLLIWAVF